MADTAVKEALDGVVKAIGFGIVSDFRELYDSMRQMSSDIRENVGVIDQVNRNTRAINETLTDFQRETYDKSFIQQARQREKALESRAKLNAQRSEESLQKILKAIENLTRQVQMGAAQGGGGGDGGIVDDVAAAAAGAAAGGGAGAFLRGAASLAKKTVVGGALLAGAAAIGAAGSYLMGGGDTSGESGASLGPASGPAGTSSTPTPAADLAKMGGTAGAVGATAGAAALISRSQMSAKQKALAKIAPKVPSYLSKFGGRLVGTIGAKSIPIFGALVGGYFSFSRFMSGDSWQAIGAEFVSGVAPNIGAVGGPAGYVGGVATTLAIQTYLICRDIYQEENAIDIKNNVVPNFDDLDMSEKAQVLNSVKGYVEAYINSMIGRSSASDATTGIAPTSTSGATMAGAGAAAAGAGAAMAGASGGGDTGATQESPSPTSGGITTGAAQNIAQERAKEDENKIPVVGGQGTGVQNQFMSQMFGGVVGENESSNLSPASTDYSSVSPSDTLATFNTSSNQAGGIYTGGGGMEALKAEIAAGEGDYGSYNRGVAGDTPPGKRTVNIQELSVGQVMEMQRQGRLFAVGKYQFIPGTLREAVNYTGVDPNQRFDAATQEKLFPYLISSAKRPTLASYLSGQHDDANAALNDLAAEFASIPQSNGRGRHDGDRAGNKAAGGLQRAEKIKGILQSLRQGGTTNQNTESTQVQPFAEGGVINPLPSDKPKAGRDLSVALQPPKSPEMKEEEDEFTSSQRTLDARKKASVSGSPKEKKKNMISSYAPYMSYLFGTMTSELSSHVNGEITADRAFQDAMNPLS